jgi:hypothetical protein
VLRKGGAKKVMNNIGQIWPSLSEAARYLGVVPASLRYAIRRNSICRGFYWKFIEE